MYTHVEKEMSEQSELSLRRCDNIEIIMALRKNKNEVTEHVNDKSERCGECDSVNLRDLKFDLFRCHLEKLGEHKDRDRKTSQCTTL